MNLDLNLSPDTLCVCKTSSKFLASQRCFLSLCLKKEKKRENVGYLFLLFIEGTHFLKNE